MACLVVSGIVIAKLTHPGEAGEEEEEEEEEEENLCQHQGLVGG